MGNTASKRSQSQGRPYQYLGHVRLPHEIQVAIASHLCPNCFTGDHTVLATEDARNRQRDLGRLAATSRYLHTVANEHRFHSFVQPYNPDYDHEDLTVGNISKDIATADRFHNKALPELLERLINYSQLSQDLKYLSIRNQTLTYKAGVTKRRLRLLISASETHQIEVPSFIPWLFRYPEYTRKDAANIQDIKFWLDGELWIVDNFMDQGTSIAFDVWMVKLLLFGLAPRLKKLLIDPDIAEDVFSPSEQPITELASVVTMVVSQAAGAARAMLFPHPHFRTEALLVRFPNITTFQNHDSILTTLPVRRVPDSPPLFPTLRRLLLASDQPGRLEHVTQILREFPQLEEFYFHRREGVLTRGNPNFSNANIFNGVHHCLRKLTYSSTLVFQYPRDQEYGIYILSWEEERFTQVPHFGSFAVLQELTIDQALLGRMSTIRDVAESPVGPALPDLAWKLPQSLRCLTIQYVYDWPQLSSQLVSVALAKNSGQFPLLRDIYVVLVRSYTITYDYAWFPHIPLLPSDELTRTTGELMEEAGIDLWTRSAAIGPPPGELEDYPRELVPPGTAIEFVVSQLPFNGL